MLLNPDFGCCSSFELAGVVKVQPEKKVLYLLLRMLLVDLD